VYIFRVSSLMSLSFAWAFASLIALADPAASPPPGTAPAATDATVVARLDELWKRRDDPAVLAEQKALIDKTLPRAG